MNTDFLHTAGEWGNTHVSLVSTVLNDLAGTQSFLRQMACQTRSPDEIVVVDAGSRDGTWEFLQRAAAASQGRVLALRDQGCNIARGRNLAIQAARHEIIVSTDVGCRWETEWLEELAAPLLADPACEAVMGSWRVRWEDQKTPWAKADPLLRGGLELRATSQSHASSRAIAYRKSLWKRIGGYPEDLALAADDTVFALLLHGATDQVAAAPIPRCLWERPQEFWPLVKEARRNFRGSAEAGLWLDYLILVGGRLLVEWLGLAGLAIATALRAPSGVTFGLGAVVLLLVMWRVRSWLGFHRTIRQRGGGASMWQVAALDYASRVWAIRGYLDGLWYGANSCRECRQRVRVAGIGWW